MLKRILLLSALAISLSAFELPATPAGLTSVTTYAQVSELVKSMESGENFTVSSAGQSIEGRELWLVQVGESDAPWRIFLYGQQHGNEVAGKEALLFLLRDIHDGTLKLPRGVALWVIPMVNPDGGEVDRRRNSAGADLNRDHTTLLQPETQALHTLARNIQPHISIDCHEFGRDSDDYLAQDWLEWPDIMMGHANNPLFDDRVVQLGEDFIKRVAPQMERSGINFSRYYVGDAPPLGELRYSAPDLDDARNGIGSYGGLSFIIESGVYRNPPRAGTDLGARVQAYSILLRAVINDKVLRKTGPHMIASARQPRLPDWVPTNYFWGRQESDPASIRVMDLSTGATQWTAAPNLMPRLIIKQSVARPTAYYISAEASVLFTQLLDNHQIEYEIIDTPRQVELQTCRADTLETRYDERYNRYAGRMWATADSVGLATLEPGGLLVPVKGLTGLRTIGLLEPLQLYGLYQYDQFHNLIDGEDRLPVYRVFY